MGQILRGCARTIEAVRRAIQHSQKSLNALAEQYGINPKTVAKWRARKTVQDAPMGPKEVRSTTLSQEEEAACVVFVNTPCCRLMIVCMPCRPAFQS